MQETGFLEQEINQTSDLVKYLPLETIEASINNDKDIPNFESEYTPHIDTLLPPISEDSIYECGIIPDNEFAFHLRITFEEGLIGESAYPDLLRYLRLLEVETLREIEQKQEFDNLPTKNSHKEMRDAMKKVRARYQRRRNQILHDPLDFTPLDLPIP